MGMTIDDMYDWLYRLKSELVVYMPKEWHEPMRCSIQDAITFSRKYQMLKADYETRLKADMVAMLTDIQLEIEDCVDGGEGSPQFEQGVDIARCQVVDIIQQKIDAFREVKKMTQEKIDYMRNVELPFICQELRDKNHDVNVEKGIEEFEKDFNELLAFAGLQLYYQTYLSHSIDRLEELLKEKHIIPR